MSRIIQTLIISAILVPVAVSAATQEELAAQISSLLQRIQQLQQQIGSTPTTPTTSTPTSPAPAGSCPRVSRVLKLGDSGADVTRLQQFLAQDSSVYPERSVTGYYGALTEAAVKRFQCKNKLVCDGTPATTGYGVTGPRTAALLALQCPDGGATTSTGGTAGQVSGFIRVTPTTGVSPLNVMVEATVNTARNCGSMNYVIDYGDGTPSSSVSVPQNGCNEIQQTFPHTYQRGGTYQVLLRAGTHQVSATVTVTQGNEVVNPSSDTVTGSPTSGATPLTVNFTGLVNSGAQCNSGPYRIDFGDGSSANIAVAGCSATNFSVPHTYTSSGTYVARLYRGTPAVNVGSVSVNAGGSVSSSGGQFSVSGGINGNPLQARALFDINSSCSRYDLDWGDGTAHAVQAEGSCSSGVIGKDLTHTYSGPGSYTITLKRGASLQNTDTAAITIVQ
ncbi:PKD domain-containing protein [bacterium]|nr:PKD domain-containing protein [bacterium]